MDSVVQCGGSDYKECGWLLVSAQRVRTFSCVSLPGATSYDAEGPSTQIV